MEPLTSKNCWLEVKVRREGFEAEWEKLGEADVPEDILAAFVRQTHAKQAIPVPGESVHACILLANSCFPPCLLSTDMSLA